MINEDIIQSQTLLLNTYKAILEKLYADITIIQLRPKFTTDLDSYFLGDTDFIIRDKDFEYALSVIYEYCKNNGINFYLDQRSVNKKRFEFFIENHDALCLVLEFWSAVEITENEKKKAISSDSIFKAIAKKAISKEEILTLIYITHLHHKKKDIFTEENKYRFKIFFQWLNKQKPSERIDSISNLLKQLQDKSLNLWEANQKAFGLINKIKLKKQNALSFKYLFYKKKVKYKFFNVKHIVPILGPDGVGKGSVSENALTQLTQWKSHRFKQLYRSNKVYKLGLLCIPNWKKQPKNKLDEKLSYYIFITASIAFQVLRICTKHNILLDRYFLDYFGTPIRYLESNQKPDKIGFYKLILFLTPTPENIVFLGCKNNSLKERKNELSEESVEFLQQIYIEFISKKKSQKVIFISTENSINNTSNNLQQFLKEIY